MIEAIKSVTEKHSCYTMISLTWFPVVGTTSHKLTGNKPRRQRGHNDTTNVKKRRRYLQQCINIKRFNYNHRLTLMTVLLST